MKLNNSYYYYLLLLTSVCLAASIWPLGHLRSDRHVSNIAVQTVVESGLAGKIHNVPQIGVEFRLKSINRTINLHV